MLTHPVVVDVAVVSAALSSEVAATVVSLPPSAVVCSCWLPVVSIGVDDDPGSLVVSVSDF